MEIVRWHDDALAAHFAALMAASEPWRTLGRGAADCEAVLRDATRERYVALDGGKPAGFVIINMAGAFTGYIQTVFAGPEWRGTGLGSRLVAFAEERIFRERPNVFLCVSHFNDGARKLYARLGYEEVGVLKDYLVEGYDEVLMRKTRGPVTTYRPG